MSLPRRWRSIALQATTVSLQHGCWPEIMTASVAAAYLDERTVEAFVRRAGKVYPRPHNVIGRGIVWFKAELDRAMAQLLGGSGPAALDQVEDAADLL
jgi:hypothetical protein